MGVAFTPDRHGALTMLDAARVAILAGSIPHADRPAGALPLTPHGRANLEAAIDYLVDFLDASDPDPDLEDGEDDEPSLGFNEGRGVSSFVQRDGMEGVHFNASIPDIEFDIADARHDGDEESSEGDGDADMEPSLGWPCRWTNGIGLLGGSSDREVQCEGGGLDDLYDDGLVF